MYLAFGRESTDYGHDDLPRLTREVIHALAFVTGDEIHELRVPTASHVPGRTGRSRAAGEGTGEAAGPAEAEGAERVAQDVEADEFEGRVQAVRVGRSHLVGKRAVVDADFIGSVMAEEVGAVGGFGGWR